MGMKGDYSSNNFGLYAHNFELMGYCYGNLEESDKSETVNDICIFHRNSP